MSLAAAMRRAMSSSSTATRASAPSEKSSATSVSSSSSAQNFLSSAGHSAASATVVNKGPVLPRHPRVTGFACGAVLGATYAVPEAALIASAGHAGSTNWAAEDWCKPLWMHPRVQSSSRPRPRPVNKRAAAGADGKRNPEGAAAAAASAADDADDASKPFCVAVPHVHADGSRWVHFPRGVGLALFGVPARDARVEGAPLSPGVEFSGRLMTTPVPQVQAVASMVAALTRSRTRMACAVMRCGFGKTVCAAAVIPRLGRAAAILVHTKQLAEQWRDRMNTFLPRARVYVHGEVNAPGVSAGNADVAVIIVQAAMRQSALSDIGVDGSRFGLIVVDETHHIAARVFSRVLRLFPAASVLGLTATPKRGDGLEKLVYWLVGYPCFTALDSEYRERTVATLTTVTLPPRSLSSWPAHLRASAGAAAYAAADRVGDGMVAKLTSTLGDNEVYARVVATDIIEKYTDGGRNVLLMSTRRRQLMMIARWMRSEAARRGAIAWVGRGLLCDRRAVSTRINFTLHVDGSSSLIPPLRDVGALVREAGARIARQGVKENLRAARDREGSLHVRVLRVDHAISGDLCVGVVPSADNLLVVIKDWDSLAIVTETISVATADSAPEGRPAAAAAAAATSTKPPAKRARAPEPRGGPACASAGGACDDGNDDEADAGDADDDDDDDDDDRPVVTSSGQRLTPHVYLNFPPVLVRASSTPARIASLTNREVLHGPCGLHRDSEASMRSYLYAFGALKLRKRMPDAVTRAVMEMAFPLCRIGFCVGGMPTNRWKPLLDCNILLSTSQQCAEGFDDPKRDTLVMTLPPRGNLKQLFGRVQRPCPVKKSPTRLLLYHVDETDALFSHKVAQWSNAVERDGFERAADETIVLDESGARA